MFHAFDFKLSRLPEGAVDSVVDKIDVNSRGCEQYGHLPDDSTGSSGRLCESRQNDGDPFLFRIGKGAFGKEDMRDVTERVRESELVTMVRTLFTERGRKYRRLIKEIDHVRAICLVFVHLRLQTNQKVVIEKEIL